MAYISYYVCDECGTDRLLSVNYTCTITAATRYARKAGWSVGKAGWLCPKCRRTGKKLPMPIKENH